MAAGKDQQVSSPKERRIDDVVRKDHARFCYYYKGTGYHLISNGSPVNESFLVTVQMTSRMGQDSSDHEIPSPTIRSASPTNKGPTNEDTVGSPPNVRSGPDRRNAFQSVPQDNVAEETSTPQPPSPLNREMARPVAPADQIAWFNPVRRRRWKSVVLIGFCFAGASVLALAAGHRGTGLASVTASREIYLHLFGISPNAPRTTINQTTAVPAKPTPFQTGTQVTTSASARSSDRSESSAVISFDAKASSSMLPEPATSIVKPSETPTPKSTEGPTPAATAASSDEQTSSSVAAEPSVEISSTIAVETPTQSRQTVEGPILRSEPLPDEVQITKIGIDALLSRGDALFAAGDVTSARMFYEKGAEAGDGTAALRLGETFDPQFLQHVHLALIRGDADKAMDSYRRAAELGNPDAKLLLGNSEVSDR